MGLNPRPLDQKEQAFSGEILSHLSCVCVWGGGGGGHLGSSELSDKYSLWIGGSLHIWWYAMRGHSIYGGMP